MNSKESEDDFSFNKIDCTENEKELLNSHLCNGIDFKDNLKSNNSGMNVITKGIELDLSVPNQIKDNIDISSTRGINSFFMKTPEFFKHVNSQEDKKHNKNLTENDFQHNIDNKSMFDQEYNDRKYNRNKSLNNATINQRPSFGFFYQTDIYDHKQMEYDNGFYANRIPEINTQSNNLFTHPFMNFNKKRSFSEADVIKSNRSNPFMHYRRNTQIHNDFYNKSVRPISDPCIDPRMFYKNMPINTMKNKENHAKPAFSYAQIITRALNGSQDGKLTLGEIYKWIEDKITLNTINMPILGKGGKWMIDEEFIAQEENRKKRKTFEEENLMNHHSYGLNSEDPRYYQM
ncbi:hypothetical protein G9O61_00g002070 [Vairimorpha ceranae]|nr:hypothetical protein G9O61_00g002070 [Vairimorpha ceranae]